MNPFRNQDHYWDDPVQNSFEPSSKLLSLFLIISILCFGIIVKTVYAANINLNSGNSSEFGQGIQVVTNCSGSATINLRPQVTFTNASGLGNFYLSGFQVSNVPSSCNGKMLSISSYTDTSTVALAMYATTSTSLDVTSTGTSFITRNTGVSLSGLSASGFTATFDTPVALASNAIKYTMQSSTDAVLASYGSASFGASDSLTFTPATAFSTGSYTVEMWVKFTSAPTSNAIIFSGSYGLALYVNSTLDQFHIVQWGPGTGDQAYYVNALSTNTWYHIAVVRDSSNSNKAQLFINGAKSINSAITDNNNYTQGVQAIAISGAGGKFVGKISNFRVTNTAVYDPTVSTISKPNAPLTAISGTKILLNTSTTSPFTDSSGNNATVTLSGNPTSSSDNPFN